MKYSIKVCSVFQDGDQDGESWRARGKQRKANPIFKLRQHRIWWYRRKQFRSWSQKEKEEEENETKKARQRKQEGRRKFKSQVVEQENFASRDWARSLEMAFFFLRLSCTCEETCQSVWPSNASLFASSTCRYLRLLGGSNPQVTGHRSQVTGHRSQVTGRRSQVTGHRSQVAVPKSRSHRDVNLWQKIENLDLTLKRICIQNDTPFYTFNVIESVISHDNPTIATLR